MTFWRTAFNAAMRLWPRRPRQSLGMEVRDAFERGYAARLARQGRGAARRFAVRAVLDAAVAGLRQRHNRRPPRIRIAGALEALRRDGVSAWRRARTDPAASLAIVVLIALGIGANAAVFSTLTALQRPPALPGVEDLVLPRVSIVSDGARSSDRLWSYDKLVELRTSADAFVGVDGYARRVGTLSRPEPAESVAVEFVTAGYFRTLGLEPSAGRFFFQDEEGASRPPDVAVLSQRAWKTRFSGRDDIVGETIEFEGRSVRIVGVAPAGFDGLTGGIQLWLPIGQSRITLGAWAMTERHLHWFHAIARLRPDATVPVAAAQLDAVTRMSEAIDARLRTDQRVLCSLPRLVDAFTPPSARSSMQIGLAAAVLLFLIVILNVATLFAIRARRESSQTALQVALGASRWSLTRSRLIEATVVVMPGAIAGLVFAHLVLDVLRGWWFDHLLRGAAGDLLLVSANSFSLDSEVVIFGMALAMIASASATVAPLLRQWRVDLHVVLRGGNGVTNRRRGWLGTKAWITGAQAALTVALVVTGALIVQSLVRLTAEQRGFDPDRLVIARYSLMRTTAGRSEAAVHGFHEALRAAVLRVPGIASVSLASTAPLGGSFVPTQIEQLPGGAPIPPAARPPLHVHVVDDAYFATVGARLVHGRPFTTKERTSAEPIVILSATAAARYLRGGDPVGQQLRFRMNGADPGTWWRVIGVAEDILFGPATAGMRPEAFIPLGMWAPPGLTIIARTTSEPLGVVPAIRAALRDVDPSVPVSAISTGDAMRAQGTAATRLLVALLGAFAGIAALVTLTTIWVWMIEAITERRREIGVRLALGATTARVAHVLQRAVAIPLIGGALLGLVAAAWCSPYLDPVLFGVGPRDGATYAIAAAGIVLAGLAASWIPARRIATIAPSAILRAT